MIEILAPAKINLCIDVLAKRPDGYHEVDMVMQSIALADALLFKNHHRLEIATDHSTLATDQRNLVWKAIQLFHQEIGKEYGVKVEIIKKIPIAAGLAGGSSDAAATLIALNELWETNFSKEKLMQLGLKLGADVPFCILQGTARARGIGEKLFPINSKLKTKLLLITPNIEVPTALVYQNLAIPNCYKRPQVERVIAALEGNSLAELTAHWGNLLEEVALKKFLLINEVKSYFARYNMNNNLMSGSGPTVFALDPNSAEVGSFLDELPPEWFGCVTEFQ